MQKSAETELLTRVFEDVLGDCRDIPTLVRWFSFNLLIDEDDGALVPFPVKVFRKAYQTSQGGLYRALRAMSDNRSGLILVDRIRRRYHISVNKAWFDDSGNLPQMPQFPSTAPGSEGTKNGGDSAEEESAANLPQKRSAKNGRSANFIQNRTTKNGEATRSPAPELTLGVMHVLNQEDKSRLRKTKRS